jgi:hypothetical protein
MSYNCEILADSLSPQGERLTSMKITFPRIMLAEFNTHRMFSRNSASSRAIPFKKMVKMVEDNPFIPIAWQKDHSGMQGTEYFTNEEAKVVYNNPSFINGYEAVDLHKHNWLLARDEAVNVAKELNYGGVTKQLCNRLLEPFMWHTVIVTSGKEGLESFFELRCPKYSIITQKTLKSKKDLIKDLNGIDVSLNTDLDWLKINKSQADIHIQAIAELMWDAYNESTPKQLKAGEYHIPNLGHEWDNAQLGAVTYIPINNQYEAIEQTKIKIATAHCAKISYNNFGTKIDYEADIKLHDMLIKSKHFSPFEHVAIAMTDEEYYTSYKGPIQVEFDDENINQDWCQLETQYCGWSRNFRGFIQYRALIDN